MKWTLNPKVDLPTSPIAKSAVSISEHSVSSANMLTVILTVHLHSTILLPLGRCEAAEGGTVIKNSDLHKQVDESKD